MPERVIISLAGRKRTGKETCYKLMYPYLDRTEEFQFATPLKKFCIEVLGLTHDQCYGADKDRETPTKYRWSWVAPEIREKYGKDPEEVITARSVLQIVGTDLLRQQFYKNIWAEAATREAINSSAQTCVLTDTRFPNELDITRDGAFLGDGFRRSIIVRLYRETGLQDSHDSETALDVYDARPNQRDICPNDSQVLLSRGYRCVHTGFWVAENPKLPFDYLIDNNYTLDTLRGSVDWILRKEEIRKEPTLS